MSGVANKLMSAAGAGGDVGAWDLSFAYYDPPAAWDISTAVYSGKSFSVAAQETSPQGLFFKPDGLKMYVVGSDGDDVNEYDLSTAWDISTATFLQVFSVAAQETTPQGLFFKPDGLKMYVVGRSGDDVNEYNLSTAWDVSTASFLQNFSVAAQETSPQGLFFKPDGLKMYVVGAAGVAISEYSLSTAWDVSTASFLQNFSVAAQDTQPTSLFFKPDGTKVYVMGGAADFVHEYNLSVAWDVSTASFLQNFSVAAQETDATSLFLKPDGTAFYVIGNTNDTVFQYTLGGFSVAAQETFPTDFFFKPDGLKMYVIGAAGDGVNEYNLSIAWDVSTASFLQVFSVAAQDTAPQGLFFKPDGTKMYVAAQVGSAVYEYDLSTAWNVSTASFLQNFSVAAQETIPQGIFFKPDGTKFYIVGATDTIYEYNLSTAWDISSTSFLQSFSVTAQETNPGGVFFKPDGLKVYVVGSTGDDVNEYNLSIAWDISTASFLQLFSVATEEILPRGLFFKDDGTQMFVIGSSTDSVFSYTLGVQP